MEKPIIIVTGCGYKLVKHIYSYKGKQTHNSIFIDGKECKMNIGTAASYYLSKKGFEIIMVSRDENKLRKIKKGLVDLGCKENLLSFIPADLFDEKGIVKLIKRLPKKRVYHLVQSIGIGGGSYKIPNDNIYLPFRKISPKLIALEMEITIATHRLILKLMPYLKKNKSKICIITSMSGERGYHFGATHVAAKHSLVGYIKGIKRELKDEGIKIFDIRPGAIDTGMYDNPFTRKSVEEVSRRTKMWKGRKPIYAPPMEVSKKVYLALFDKNSQEIYRILAPYQN